MALHKYILCSKGSILHKTGSGVGVMLFDHHSDAVNAAVDHIKKNGGSVGVYMVVTSVTADAVVEDVRDD